MSIISKFLGEKRRPKIAVLGDALLDEYFQTHAERISPEFPIVVQHSTQWRPVETAPGGAANVANQFKYFPADIYLLCFLDKCSQQSFSQYSFNSDYCVQLDSGFIPIKRRFYDGDFPLSRHDIEEKNYGANNIERKRQELYENLEKLLSEQSIEWLILSDYGKGVFSPEFSQKVLKLCNSRSVQTIVDPKSLNLEQWEGCSIIKPNIKYGLDCAEKYHIASTNDLAFSYISEYLQWKTGCQHVVITDSGNGIYVDEKYISPHKKPHVKSVIGAGDCCCALLTLALAQGYSVINAAQIGFNAGSVYVEAKHNQPITPYQLARWDNPIAAKITTVESLVSIKGTFPLDKIWVFTSGVFDLFHVGHAQSLELAKSYGDKLIVGVNSDETVRKLKGPSRPILTLENRIKLLASLQVVDFVVEFSEDTPYNTLQALNPNIFVKGEQYRGVSAPDLEWGGEVRFAPMIEDCSTTKIIERIYGNRSSF